MTDLYERVATALLAGSDHQCSMCKAHAEKFAPRVAAAIEATLEEWHPDPGNIREQDREQTYKYALAALRGE